MTTFQIVSLVVLVVAVAGSYGQFLWAKLPQPKPGNKLLSHIEAVVRVRDAYADQDVTAACNAVLAALLKVKP